MGTGQGCQLLSLLFNTVFKVLETTIRQKEVKGIQIGKKEAKWSLFTDDMILYTKNPKVSTLKIVIFIERFQQSCRIQD